MPCVRTDVTHAAALSGLLGIVAPNGIVAALKLDTLRQPPLRILHEDTAHTAQIAALDALLGLLDGRIAAVYVRQGQRKTRLADLVAQLERLLQRKGHGLVDDNVETQFERPHGRSEMETVGCHNGNEIHTLVLGQRSLLLEHLLPRSINTVIGDIIRTARADRYFGIDAETSADEFDLVLHEGSATVNGADEGVASAADHTHSQLSVFHYL